MQADHGKIRFVHFSAPIITIIILIFYYELVVFFQVALCAALHCIIVTRLHINTGGLQKSKPLSLIII